MDVSEVFEEYESVVVHVLLVNSVELSSSSIYCWSLSVTVMTVEWGVEDTVLLIEVVTVLVLSPTYGFSEP